MFKDNKNYEIFGNVLDLKNLIVLTTTKIFSQAQGQELSSEGRSNFCTPHTNKIDSPSIPTWANLGAPKESDFHRSYFGAPHNYEITKLTNVIDNCTNGY